MGHDWPGNVRALEETLERAVLSHKGLRLLQPEHLSLGKTAPPPVATVQKRRIEVVAKDNALGQSQMAGFESYGLRNMLTALAAFPYDRLTAPDLIASYGIAREAMGRCLAGLLRQALVATSRATAEKPSGEIYYTPAIHLLFGIQEKDKKKWPTSKCADRVREIIGFSATLKDELLTDDVLRTAYDAATRLRQKK
jgi:hypothetical protein